MRSRLLILPVAGLLLVGAAGVALAQSGGTPATPPAAAADPSASPDASGAPAQPRDTVLDQVLKDLVDKGTITQGQSDAIVNALGAKRAELRTQAQELRQQLRQILADGKITKDEIDQLPADSPLRKLGTMLDDGVITQDELRGLGFLGRGFGPGGGFGHGGGFGPHRGGMMWGDDGDGAAPSAAPNASPGSSS